MHQNQVLVAQRLWCVIKSFHWSGVTCSWAVGGSRSALIGYDYVNKRWSHHSPAGHCAQLWIAHSSVFLHFPCFFHPLFVFHILFLFVLHFSAYTGVNFVLRSGISLPSYSKIWILFRLFAFWSVLWYLQSIFSLCDFVWYICVLLLCFHMCMSFSLCFCFLRDEAALPVSWLVRPFGHISCCKSGSAG